MRKLLTALAATSLIGSLFLGAPAPVVAGGATTWKVNKATGEGSIIHYDVSRDTLGKTQTYAAPAGAVLEMNLYLQADTTTEDLDDTVTLTLTNAQFTDTTPAVAYGNAEAPADGTDCVIDWDPTDIGGASGGELDALVDCDTDGIGDDYYTTVSFEITLAAAGTSAVLEVSGAGTSGKVYFFGTEANDDIYVSAGTLGTAATPADGNCADPDFSTAVGQPWGSVQEAIFSALTAVDGNDDEIIICDGTYAYSGNIEQYLGSEQWDETIHITAAASATVKLDGIDDYSLLSANFVDLDITGIEFEDGDRTSGGAVNLETGDLTLTNTIFDSNEATGFDGGAVRVTSGDVDVFNSTFTNNRANQSGGAIHIAVSGDLTVTGSNFTNNGVYNDDGGALSVASGDVTVDDSEFIDNFADDHGGALYAFNGDVVVTDSNFEANYSDFKGGAIANKTPADTDIYTMSIEDSTFDGNSADYKGGAVFSDHDTLLDVDASTFTDNETVNDDGGAIYSRDDATIGFSVFLRNKTLDDDGGAIYFDEHAVIHDSRFVDNYADEEGGAVFGETWTFVDDTVFLRNRSLEWAGALSLAGNAWLDGAIFRANKSRRGGAIDSWGDRLYLVESRFINNRATRDGGAIIRDGETLFGDVGPDTIFRGNQARLGDSVAIYRWKKISGGPGLVVARTWSRVWVAAGTTVWLVR